MFSNNRRKTLRNRIFFVSLGVLLMSLGIWLNLKNDSHIEETIDTVNQVTVKEESTKETTEETKEEKEEIEKEEEKGGTVTESIPEAYLIKEVEGVVKVFLCHRDGKQELYLTTSVPFELLSQSDQQLLRQGVELKTEEDLGKFLENFDS